MSSFSLYRLVAHSGARRGQQLRADRPGRGTRDGALPGAEPARLGHAQPVALHERDDPADVAVPHRRHALYPARPTLVHSSKDSAN